MVADKAALGKPGELSPAPTACYLASSLPYLEDAAWRANTLGGGAARLLPRAVACPGVRRLRIE